MKWEKIPRALRDVMQVLLQSSVPWADRMMIARALCKMKWSLHAQPEVDTTSVELVGRKVELFNDAASQFVLKEIWLARVYEPMVHIQPKYILDLGANQGLAGLYFVQHCAGLETLVMYEPEEACYQLLGRNLPEAEKHLEAVGPVDGNARLVSKGVVNHRLSVLGEGNENRGSNQGEATEVNVVSMRSLLERHWDLVKMDIEGAEWEVLADLAGTPEWLGRGKYWMIEFHQDLPSTKYRSQIFEAFASIGYTNRQRGDVVHFYHEGPLPMK